MMAQQRHTLILELLSQNGMVHTADLVRQMDVSSETVRKDLDYLEQEGRLVRVHGGAMPVTDIKEPVSTSQYVSFQIRNTQHMEQKRAITLAAASMVKEKQVIALDYGSTSQMMAMTLKEQFKSLTVITNSIQNAMILSECPDYTIILTGGILNKEEHTLVNDFTPLLEHLHIDILFMTLSGVDPAIGCTDLHFSEARTQNQMRQAASRTVVMADSSKFGKASLVKICAVQDVDAIITDDGLTDSMASAIRRTGTELMIVPLD